MSARETYKPYIVYRRSYIEKKRNTKYEVRSTKKGIALILTFIFMVALTIITAAYMFMATYGTRNVNAQINNDTAFYLAEAGLNKAVWNLKTPTGSGGEGEDWTTAGTTESLGSGDYTMVVERWDFALADNAASASVSSSTSGHDPEDAIDGSDSTYWQSETKPTPDNPQEIIIDFPSTLTINKVRFYLPSGYSQQRPKAYSWQVSTDGVSYTTVASDTNNGNTDVTDEFTEASNVNYLKLEVTKVGGEPFGVMIATLETIGSKITSTGTASGVSRKMEQTVVIDDTTETASGQKDWKEITP